VEAPVPYDMFTFLRNRGLYYGFVATQNEMAKFVTGLHPDIGLTRPRP
jgi:hypothetical protein